MFPMLFLIIGYLLTYLTFYSHFPLFMHNVTRNLVSSLNKLLHYMPTRNDFERIFCIILQVILLCFLLVAVGDLRRTAVTKDLDHDHIEATVSKWISRACDCRAAGLSARHMRQQQGSRESELINHKNLNFLNLDSMSKCILLCTSLT